jgi:hypothetical protein
VLFRYTKRRDSGAVDSVLRGYSGYLVADAHAATTTCIATALSSKSDAGLIIRRYFFKALESDPERAKTALAPRWMPAGPPQMPCRRRPGHLHARLSLYLVALYYPERPLVRSVGYSATASESRDFFVPSTRSVRTRSGTHPPHPRSTAGEVTPRTQEGAAPTHSAV